MITIPTYPDYHKNQERAGDLLPCVVCGKGIKAENPEMVHVHDGGIVIVMEEEAAAMPANADMYFFPIGPCCLRKHPEIKPYTQSSQIRAKAMEIARESRDAAEKGRG